MPRSSSVNARKQQRATSGRYSNSKQAVMQGDSKPATSRRSEGVAKRKAARDERNKAANSAKAKTQQRARKGGKFSNAKEVEARKTSSASAKPKSMTLGKVGKAGRILSRMSGGAGLGIAGLVGAAVEGGRAAKRTSDKARKNYKDDKSNATSFSSAAKAGQGTKRAVTKGTKAEQEARSTAKGKSKTVNRETAANTKGKSDGFKVKAKKATSAAPNKKSRQSQSKMANSADYGGRKTVARTRKSGDRKSRSYADK